MRAVLPRGPFPACPREATETMVRPPCQTAPPPSPVHRTMYQEHLARSRLWFRVQSSRARPRRRCWNCLARRRCLRSKPSSSSDAGEHSLPSTTRSVWRTTTFDGYTAAPPVTPSLPSVGPCIGGALGDVGRPAKGLACRLAISRRLPWCPSSPRAWECAGCGGARTNAVAGPDRGRSPGSCRASAAG